MRFISIIIFIFMTGTIHASEVDQFTDRFKPLADSATFLNSMVNRYIQDSIKAVNQNRTCDAKESENALYAEMRKYLNNRLKKAGLVKLIFDAPEDQLDRRRFLRNQTVYREWKPGDGYSLGRKGAGSNPLALAPVIRVGKITIGSDKLSHLFYMGFRYFLRHHQRGEPLQNVFKIGIFSEETVLGLGVFATGIFSYGDLSANFNGMRFWNHVLQKRDDAMGGTFNIGPYVECKNKYWQQVAPVDLRNYFDWASDEGVNCNRFATQKAANKVRKQLLELTRRSKAPRIEYKCPMDSRKLSDMVEKYGDFAPWFINTQGPGTRSMFNWKPSVSSAISTAW